MMIDHGQAPPKDIPNWIFTAMTLCPYSACAVTICRNIALTLAYSMKFQRIAERYWYYSTLTGIAVVLVVLELMRASIMTIVELRKFEIRRRLAGGDFNKSRVRKQSAASRDPLHPHRSDKKKPKVPEVAPKKPPLARPPPPPKDTQLGKPPPEISEADLSRPPPPSRPAFLPPEDGGPAISGNIPFLRTAEGAGLPVGAPPPPTGKAPPAFGPGTMGK